MRSWYLQLLGICRRTGDPEKGWKEIEGESSKKPRGASEEHIQLRKALRTAAVQSRDLASHAVGS